MYALSVSTDQAPPALVVLDPPLQATVYFYIPHIL